MKKAVLILFIIGCFVFPSEIKSQCYFPLFELGYFTEEGRGEECFFPNELLYVKEFIKPPLEKLFIKDYYSTSAGPRVNYSSFRLVSKDTIMRISIPNTKINVEIPFKSELRTCSVYQTKSDFSIYNRFRHLYNTNHGYHAYNSVKGDPYKIYRSICDDMFDIHQVAIWEALVSFITDKNENKEVGQILLDGLNKYYDLRISSDQVDNMAMLLWSPDELFQILDDAGIRPIDGNGIRWDSEDKEHLEDFIYNAFLHSDNPVTTDANVHKLLSYITLPNSKYDSYMDVFSYNMEVNGHVVFRLGKSDIKQLKIGDIDRLDFVSEKMDWIVNIVDGKYRLTIDAKGTFSTPIKHDDGDLSNVLRFVMEESEMRIYVVSSNYKDRGYYNKKDDKTCLLYNIPINK